MFNYLYYKLYKASLKSSLYDIANFMTSISLGSLISANILVISGFLSKLIGLPFLFSNSYDGGIFASIIIIFTFLYYSKKRLRLILKKYSQESQKARIKGNIIVSIYVVISFFLIFAVAFFRV